MISTRLYRDGKLLEENFDADRVSDELSKRGTLIWLDVEDPSESEIAMVEEEFSLHPLAAEDVRHQDQRTKIEVYEAEGYSFVVLHGMALENGDLLDQEVHVFVGSGYLVTLRYPPAYPLAPVTRRWDRRTGLVGEGAGFFLWALLDEIVDGYFEVVEGLEDESEVLEGQVFSEDAPEDLQERIFMLRKKVLEFRRRVMPLREVLELIQKETGLATEKLSAYYRDVADHVYRVLEFIDLVRELLTTGLEALLTQVSNRLNLVMKQLTSWAAIILVPTLIAGIYGMNFRHMPELMWRFGYAWALGLMAVSGGVLYFLFKRRGWL